jgi:hypothetical protein
LLVSVWAKILKVFRLGRFMTNLKSQVMDEGFAVTGFSTGPKTLAVSEGGLSLARDIVDDKTEQDEDLPVSLICCRLLPDALQVWRSTLGQVR